MNQVDTILSECITLLTELGVPISGSISPDIQLNDAQSGLGMCWIQGSREGMNGYDYYIEIPRKALLFAEESVRNILIHELLHTVPGGCCRSGEWYRWAAFVNDKTSYDLQPDGDDATEGERHNVLMNSSPYCSDRSSHSCCLCIYSQ